MHFSKRKKFKLLRSGTGVVTTTYDLGVGWLDDADALLIHAFISVYSAGTLTVNFGAYLDGYANGNTRILGCTATAWTTAALNAVGGTTLIIAPPIPLDGFVTATYATTPNMTSIVAVEAVSYR